MRSGSGRSRGVEHGREGGHAPIVRRAADGVVPDDAIRCGTAACGERQNPCQRRPNEVLRIAARYTPAATNSDGGRARGV